MSDFPLKPVPESKAANGKPCWACPCCSGCENTGAAKAAGCGLLVTKGDSEPASLSDAEISPTQNALSDSDISPKQKALLKSIVDSELESKGLNVVKHGKGSGSLAWRTYRKVPIEPEEPPADPKAEAKKHGMYKRMHNGRLVEDTISPSWLTGSDWFENPTKYAKKKRGIKDPWIDPSGLFSHNPLREFPWYYSSHRHWDCPGPECPAYEWQDWDHTVLDAGNFTHGKHKNWKDLPDAQWGWQHQFADWDPDGAANNALLFGSGSIPQTGLAGDGKNDAITDVGTNPWEFSWVGGGALHGDAFVPMDEVEPHFTKPVNNEFADWEQESDKNQDLVFGDNHASLRQRIALPIGKNWNMVEDSKVKPSDMQAQLKGRGPGPSKSVTHLQATGGMPSPFADWEDTSTVKPK